MTMDEIQKQEEMVEAHMSASSTKSVAMAVMKVNMAKELSAALSSWSEGKVDTVVFMLNGPQDTFVLESSSNQTPEQLAKKLPAKEPRYILQRFPHQNEGKDTTASVFLFYCPEMANPKLKMPYASSKSVAVLGFNNAGIVITKNLEVSTEKEVTSDAYLSELYPKTTEKKTMAKPKLPGKAGGSRMHGAVKFDASKSPTSPSSPSSAKPSGTQDAKDKQ